MASSSSSLSRESFSRGRGLGRALRRQQDLVQAMFPPRYKAFSEERSFLVPPPLVVRISCVCVLEGL